MCCLKRFSVQTRSNLNSHEIAIRFKSAFLPENKSHYLIGSVFLLAVPPTETLASPVRSSRKIKKGGFWFSKLKMHRRKPMCGWQKKEKTGEGVGGIWTMRKILNMTPARREGFFFFFFLILFTNPTHHRGCFTYLFKKEPTGSVWKEQGKGDWTNLILSFFIYLFF